MIAVIVLELMKITVDYSAAYDIKNGLRRQEDEARSMGSNYVSPTTAKSQNQPDQPEPDLNDGKIQD